MLQPVVHDRSQQRLAAAAGADGAVTRARPPSPWNSAARATTRPAPGPATRPAAASDPSPGRTLTIIPGPVKPRRMERASATAAWGKRSGARTAMAFLRPVRTLPTRQATNVPEAGRHPKVLCGGNPPDGTGGTKVPSAAGAGVPHRRRRHAGPPPVPCDPPDETGTTPSGYSKTTCQGVTPPGSGLLIRQAVPARHQACRDQLLAQRQRHGSVLTGLPRGRHQRLRPACAVIEDLLRPVVVGRPAFDGPQTELCADANGADTPPPRPCAWLARWPAAT